MEYGIIISLVFLYFILSTDTRLYRLLKHEYFYRKILREARYIRRVKKEIEEKERKVAIVKKAIVQSIHHYRDECFASKES